MLRTEENGHFRKDVIVQMDLRTLKHSFEMFFRTHCYVQNRFGEVGIFKIILLH